MPRRTLERPVESAGTGIHSGRPVRLRLEPAPAGTGIVLQRTDLEGRPSVPALLNRVVATDRRTVLAEGQSRVETVEHLLAALRLSGIDDGRVLLDGPEVPNFDGSFMPFVALIDAAGTREQAGHAGTLQVAGEFEVAEGDARYRVEPAPALSLEVRLEYREPVIGTQVAHFGGGAGEFAREIAPARTYGFIAELAALRDRDLARGATEAAGVLLADDRPLNTTFRWPNECARHKLGDLLGDLALLGHPLCARIRAERPSHRGNNACARAIAARARLVEEG